MIDWALADPAAGVGVCLFWVLLWAAVIAAMKVYGDSSTKIATGIAVVVLSVRGWKSGVSGSAGSSLRQGWARHARLAYAYPLPTQS